MDPDIKKEILEIIDRHLGKRCMLMVFGSFARGSTDRLSDIDLAVYRREPIPTATLVELKEELENRVHTLRDIDVVDLGSEHLYPPLLGNILDEGVVWKKPANFNELLRNLQKRLITSDKR